jgi:phosphatidylserine/phosphatidylglycerophosphate/cardiolipin synthase-like enzyme
VIRFLTDRALYEAVLRDAVPEAAEFVWLATADLKDLHVPAGRRAEPFLAVLAGLLDRGVAVRLLHAKEPGPRFRADFDRYPVLLERLERMLCPRVHFKCVVVDGRWAYSGSANLTGAGLGAKSARRRNFEQGFVTDDPGIVSDIAETFDRVWMGAHCDACGRRAHCAEGPANDR